MTETKETVYDAEISPLMGQIIAICKREGIPVHTSFQLDGDLTCTTHIHPSDAEVAEDDRDSVRTWRAIYDRATAEATGTYSPLMLTTRDGSGNVKSIEAVVSHG